MPPRRQREREVVDEQPVAVALASAARPRRRGRRGAGRAGSRSAASPARFSADSASATSCSYAVMRALPLAWRARGAMRIHSSSRASVRRRVSSTFSSCASRCVLLLEPARVVALPRDAVRRGRARGSSPRRCRGSSGRASPRRRCRGTPAGAVRATRPIRRRGGSSARRAAAGRASTSSKPAQRDPAALTTGQLRDVGVGRRAAAARPSRCRAGGRGPSR